MGTIVACIPGMTIPHARTRTRTQKTSSPSSPSPPSSLSWPDPVTHHDCPIPFPIAPLSNRIIHLSTKTLCARMHGRREWEASGVSTCCRFSDPLEKHRSLCFPPASDPRPDQEASDEDMSSPLPARGADPAVSPDPPPGQSVSLPPSQKPNQLPLLSCPP